MAGLGACYADGFNKQQQKKRETNDWGSLQQEQHQRATAIQYAPRPENIYIFPTSAPKLPKNKNLTSFEMPE